MPDFDASALIRRLDSIAALDEAEKQALVELPMQVAEIKSNQDIVRERSRPSASFLMLRGIACSYKVTGEGKRQILAFHIPGDMPDLQSLHLTVLDCSIGTITPCTVGFVQHQALQALCDRFPRIAHAFWRQTLIDAAMHREWIVNTGRRPAYERMAHLLCEAVVRLRAVGLADRDGCDLPITQSEFGDALGLSTVHVNRVLQELRGAGLIVLKGSILSVLDWDGLKAAGDFDPAYLHFEQGAEVP
jgi:CRP-like cAMP-binding protein